MKVDLVLRLNEFTSFTSYYLEKFWAKFFNISIYDQNKTYDKKRTLFAVWWMNIDSDPWVNSMKQQGYKIVVDNLWEPQMSRKDYYIIQHQRAICWNESLWWRALGYSTYEPKKDLQYISLMQIRSFRPQRDQLIKNLQSLLPKMLWSYLAQNKCLPNDTDNEIQKQRYMHPLWYDTTFCSLVVETLQHSEFFVSEKSYKPLAYYHPCLIFGVPGTLKFLKEYGFETFDNLFDESYDDIADVDTRLKIIKNNLANIELNNYDTLTVEKLRHNHNLFFDQNLACNNIEKHIVQPLIDYAET